MAKKRPDTSTPYPAFNADKLRKTNASKLDPAQVQHHDKCLADLDKQLNKQGSRQK
jgi:hypothetical protein